MEKKSCPDVIDVDAQFDSLAHIYQAMEELHKETKDGWTKLASPLEQVIQAHNTMEKGLYKQDQQITQREDIMDGRVAANCVKIQELQTKVTGIFALLNLSSAKYWF